MRELKKCINYSFKITVLLRLFSSCSALSCVVSGIDVLRKVRWIRCRLTPMNNKQIAKVFEDIPDILELKRGDQFKTRAYYTPPPGKGK